MVGYRHFLDMGRRNCFQEFRRFPFRLFCTVNLVTMKVTANVGLQLTENFAIIDFAIGASPDAAGDPVVRNIDVHGDPWSHTKTSISWYGIVFRTLIN